ncbi:MAG: hypothetical protein PHD51_03415 [Patescibacteria group bacterium]|nr:hypothetical protein [Patescibacteria group bacterium]MDD5490974.1 hypothetical protein [Patescibacteria group bacterium]
MAKNSKPKITPRDIATEIGKNKTLAKIKTQKNGKRSVPEELIGIYKDENGLPDMSKLEKIKSHRLRNTLILTGSFLGLLAIAAWLGFFVFGGLTKFKGENIRVEITGPETFSSGQEINYIVKYRNEEKIPISKVEITAQYPQGFVFASATPQPLNENKNRWSLGTIASRSEGEIKITGKLLGNINSDKTITIYFDYRPSNFNADFQEVASLNTKITSSVIDVALDSPEEIIAGEPTDFSIKYKNNSPEALTNIKISIRKPDNLSLKAIVEPAEENAWIIPELKPAEEQKIDFSGTFLSDTSGKQEITLQVSLQNATGEWYLQQEKTFLLEVLKGELIANLIINGSTDNQTINFGDTLNYSLVYKNKGQTTIKDLVIKANLSGDLPDWKSLVDENEGKIEGQKIIWTSEEIKSLATLKPDEEGTINWQIKIKNRADFKGEGEIASSLLSWVDIEIGEVGDSKTGTTITSKTIANELNSDLALEVMGRYFNDDNIALGSGPLPPEVNKATSYRVIWKLSNSVHEISNVKVKTILPDNVYWTGKSVVSAGQLNFNVNTREIIWTINRLPLSVRELEGSFEVSITPTPAEAGNFIKLTPETALEAYDKKTNAQILLTAGPVTTNLDSDPMAEGKGIVSK